MQLATKKSVQLSYERPRQSHQFLEKVDKQHLSSSTPSSIQNCIHLYLTRRLQSSSRAVRMIAVQRRSRCRMRNGLLQTSVVT